MKPAHGTAYTFYIGLTDRSARPQFKASATIASGDWKISKDGGAFTNLATLPDVYPSGGVAVRIQLSATEMEAANVVIQGIDAAGAEWDDVLIHLQPEQTTDIVSANLVQIDGAATSGNNAALNLKSLNVTNDAGTAVVFESTGGLGNGLSVVGCSGGAGENGAAAIRAQGGGPGIGGNAGNGINASGGSGGYGISASIAGHITGDLNGSIHGQIDQNFICQAGLLDGYFSFDSNSVTIGLGEIFTLRENDCCVGTRLVHFVEDSGLKRIIQTRIVTAYDASIGKFTVDEPWSTDPAAGDSIYITWPTAGTVGITDSAIDGIWAKVISGTRTAIQLMRGMSAALIGKSSDHGSGTPKYRDVADAKNVISATTDTDGNRTSVTLDLD